jgi:hypothetical protein
MNVNNFIGSTHLDALKTITNLISSSNYGSSNYTSNCSNILNINSSNYTSNCSNILNSISSNYTNITSNIIQSNINRLIKEEIQTITTPTPQTLKHTFINNFNNFGDIYFKTSISYPVDETALTGTKIDYTGKLFVYHNYNALQPLFPPGYYDVEGEILALKADGINTDGQLTILEATTVALQTEIDDIIIAANAVEGNFNSLLNSIYHRETYEDFKGLIETTDFATQTTRYTQTINRIGVRGSQMYQDAFLTGFAFTAAAGFTMAAGAAIGSFIYYQYASNALITNENFTDTQKRALYDNNIVNQLQTYDEYNKSMSNLSILNGFINSNIQDIQYIPNLSTSNLYINTGNLNKIVSSSSIVENGAILSNKYLTSNHLYNLISNYSTERQYPSKLYNTASVEDTATIVGKLSYHQILYLDNSGVSYGSGFYEVFSSSTYDTPTTKNI